MYIGSFLLVETFPLTNILASYVVAAPSKCMKVIVVLGSIEKCFQRSQRLEVECQ